MQDWQLGLGVLPTLENKFEAVAVGVEHVAGIVTRIVIEPSTWFAIVGRARRHRGGIGCIDLGLRLRDEADMRRPAIGHTLPQPENEAPLAAEALEIRMPRRAVLAVKIDAVGDPERRQRLRIKGGRSFDVADL